MSSLLERVARSGVSHVAQQTEMSSSYVGRVLNGSRTPSLDKAERLAHYFGMSVGRFYEGLGVIQGLPKG